MSWHAGRADVRIVRVRQPYVLSLAVAVAALAAYVTVPSTFAARDRAEAGRAWAIAATYPDPPGSTPRDDCPPDAVRCLRTTAPEALVLHEALDWLTDHDLDARDDCTLHRPPRHRPELRLVNCHVVAGVGHHHAVFVFVTTDLRLADGRLEAGDTLVEVQTA